MGKIVIVGIELNEVEDNALRIEAARAGLSKRKFARKIVTDWLEENHVKNLREIYDNILDGIIANTTENSAERNELLDTVLSFSDSCAELVKLTIRTESGKINHNAEIEDISAKIENKQQVLNAFCATAKIMPFPNKPILDLAFEFVNEYRNI